MNKLKIGIGAVIAVLLLLVFLWIRSATKGDHLDFGTDNEIDVTPTQITSIKAIGEWEFLSISAEELVDTLRKGIFSNDELARIYYGTLRLGVNMHQARPGWIKTTGDSVTVTLPKIGLLDKDFNDEARTKSFYESGKWSTSDREAMYRKAHRQMMRHCLTKENLQAAEANGREQFERMMQAMGFAHVNIIFEH